MDLFRSLCIVMFAVTILLSTPSSANTSDHTDKASAEEGQHANHYSHTLKESQTLGNQDGIHFNTSKAHDHPNHNPIEPPTHQTSNPHIKIPPHDDHQPSRLPPKTLPENDHQPSRPPPKTPPQKFYKASPPPPPKSKLRPPPKTPPMKFHRSSPPPPRANRPPPPSPPPPPRTGHRFHPPPRSPKKPPSSFARSSMSPRLHEWSTLNAKAHVSNHHPGDPPKTLPQKFYKASPPPPPKSKLRPPPKTPPLKFHRSSPPPPRANRPPPPPTIGHRFPPPPRSPNKPPHSSARSSMSPRLHE